MIRPGVAAVLLCTACSPSAAIATCDDDLRGVWTVEDSGARWMLLDHGATLEAFPLFADGAPAAASPELEIAPRVIDLVREAGGIRGNVKRRFMRATDTCTSTSTVRVTACRGDTLELVLAEPVAPLAFTPCTWGTTAPSRRERWRRP